jgi:hypothetical protein
MRPKLLITIVFICLSILCKGQSPAKKQTQIKEKGFDYGKVENNIYTNSFFNFEIAIPENWTILSKEQQNNMQKTGRKLIAGDDENLNAIIKASEVNTAYLLSTMQYEQGTAVEYNPGIAIVAENTKNFPGIKTGSDYLFQSRKFLESSQLKYDYIDKEFTKVTINGTDYYAMNASIKYMNLDIKQTFYAIVKKGFSIAIIISYVSDEQKATLLKSINSMKFNK